MSTRSVYLEKYLPKLNLKTSFFSIKKQIAEAKSFKFGKIFREQLSTFASNDLYCEFQQSYINRDIGTELLILNLLL